MTITLRPNDTYTGHFNYKNTVEAAFNDVIFIYGKENTAGYAITVNGMSNSILSVGSKSYVNLTRAGGDWYAFVGNNSTLNSTSDGGYIYTGRSEYNSADLIGASSTVIETGNNTKIVTTKGNIANITVKGSNDKVALNANDSLTIGGNGEFATSGQIDSVQVLSATYGPLVYVTPDSNVAFNAPFIAGQNKGAFIQLFGHDQVTLGNNDTVYFDTTSGQGLDIINNFNSTDHLSLVRFRNITDADYLLNHTEYHKGYSDVDLGTDATGAAQTLRFVGATHKVLEGWARNNFIYSSHA